MRRTTIKDVAALAGVSPATVSRTLDDRPEISAETKERVRAACAQLGYVPNAAAKGLTGQATHTLGVVVPDVSNPYFTGIATAIEETAAENGYRVLLSNSLQEEGRELRAIENFLARQIDGVLISPLSRESQAKHADLLEGTPCVVPGREPRGEVQLCDGRTMRRGRPSPSGICCSWATGTWCFWVGVRTLSPVCSGCGAFAGR